MKWYPRNLVLYSHSSFKPHFNGPLAKIGIKKFASLLHEQISYYQTFYEDELPGYKESNEKLVTFVRDGKEVTIAEENMTRYDRHCCYTVAKNQNWRKGCFVAKDEINKPYLTIQ